MSRAISASAGAVSISAASIGALSAGPVRPASDDSFSDQPCLTVERIGPQVLVQDRGREGYAGLAITESGAMDVTSHDIANRVVGNPPEAASLEVFMGGLMLLAHSHCTVAVTGAAAEVSINGVHRSLNVAILLHPGDRLRLSAPQQGLRNYVAVRGGFAVEDVLGSRSSDPTTGIGPAPVAVGDTLPIGPEPEGDVPLTEIAPALGHREDLVLTGTWGPRADWFTEAARRSLTATPWQVTTEANRVGIRLSGTTLERSETGELPSEGLVRGAVQVPANGQPLVFSSDHPTTGGYPVIAVVDPECVDLLAQARPGSEVRFRLRELPRL